MSIPNEQWSTSLDTARRWINDRFPYYSRQISPDSTLDTFVEGLRIKIVNGLRSGKEEVDAGIDIDENILRINSSRMDPKSIIEIISILIHEIVEGYGIASLLHSGMGFNILRPEHDFAEYIESHYREETDLPRCEFALDEETQARMARIDEFYRKYPIWRRYIGDKLDDLLGKNPNVPINDNFRDRILALCPI